MFKSMKDKIFNIDINLINSSKNVQRTYNLNLYHAV